MQIYCEYDEKLKKIRMVCPDMAHLYYNFADITQKDNNHGNKSDKQTRMDSGHHL